MERDINDQHWITENYRERIPAKKWKQMLLADEDNLICCGRLRQLKSKNLGFGVVEIYKAPLKVKEKK